MKFYYLFVRNVCRGTFRTIAAAERFGDKLGPYTVKCRGRVVAEKSAG